MPLAVKRKVPRSSPNTIGSVLFLGGYNHSTHSHCPLRLLLLLHYGLNDGAYRGLLLLELELHQYVLLHHGGHHGRLHHCVHLWLVRLRPVLLHG